MTKDPAVAFVTLGCGRNEVDSDQVGGLLEQDGFRVVADPGAADCVVVNTCTFIEQARQESIDAVLEACDAAPNVIVIGCMAQRYGDELATALPEAAAVVGFADYPKLAGILRGAVSGRQSLPLVEVPAAPPTAGFPVRTAPHGPWAYMKLAGGCDRACTFCTIPSYRGTFASRPVDELVAEARWLADQGVREIVGVSENTTSWGKDLDGGRGLQPELVAALGQVDGLERVRLMYLQPDELRGELLDAMAASPVVAGYYDLSLQHASGSVLQRMARTGSAQRFLDLVAGIRARDPGAVFRSSFIIGFPGETEEDVTMLEDFLAAAGLDWTGFFTYSAEEGTPAAAMEGQVSPEEARARRDRLVEVAEAVAEDRAEGFVGRRLSVLVESRDGADAVGRSYREAPETDGEVRVESCAAPPGELVDVIVTGAEGVDLLAR